MSTGLAAAVEYHIVNSLGWSDLRPLQREAVQPVRGGGDALLLAPTAGGKTEAAVFPLLSEMADNEWRAMSVLYVTPLKALLNNLHPRLTGYAQWLGRTVGIWHGDVGPAERRRIVADPPDILLTTPESIEAMLVSTKVDHRAMFANVRAVVVDELHAFAGDDRGWHLLAVLERVQRLAGRRIQRVGLTATVGNPSDLLVWLGGGAPPFDAAVVAPDVPPMVSPPADADVTLDYVGTTANAATVIAALHAGEKRLAFCESRAQAEDLAFALREHGVTTFVSHSSLSAEERRTSEQAFAEARNCVVVSTSTLELGIDVGDLDRVIQVDSPRTVSSFLQRLGRTGRRPGSTRNMLFLATSEDSLLRAAGLLTLWREGFVEPVVPPPSPRHITAQQLLGLALQQGAYGRHGWPAWWQSLEVMDRGEDVLEHLLAESFLEADQDLLFIGQATEEHFGRRNFMDLTAVFTAEPELTVVHGRTEIGSIAPQNLFAQNGDGRSRPLALAGRAWSITHVDWKRRTVFVSPVPGSGKSQWGSAGPGLGAELAGSMRRVLLGQDPDVKLSRRAQAALERVRESGEDTVAHDATVLLREGGSSTWWTFAGAKANTSIAAALMRSGVEATADSLAVRIDSQPEGAELRALVTERADAAPVLDEAAMSGLKFSTALPEDMARAVMAERTTDPAGARVAADQPMRVVVRQ